MNTNERIAASLEAWAAARQKISRLQSEDYVLHDEVWDEADAAIAAALTLASSLATLADDIKSEAERLREHLATLEDEALRTHRDTDRPEQ
jgi:hypothetical protein